MCLSNCFVKFQYLSDFTIYIDGSNVAYFGFNKSKKPKLSNILQIINYLITEIGFKRKNIHCICDPSLKYYIENPNGYEMLVKEDVIIVRDGTDVFIVEPDSLEEFITKQEL